MVYIKVNIYENTRLVFEYLKNTIVWLTRQSTQISWDTHTPTLKVVLLAKIITIIFSILTNIIDYLYS